MTTANQILRRLLFGGIVLALLAGVLLGAAGYGDPTDNDGLGFIGWVGILAFAAADAMLLVSLVGYGVKFGRSASLEGVANPATRYETSKRRTEPGR